MTIIQEFLAGSGTAQILANFLIVGGGGAGGVGGGGAGGFLTGFEFLDPTRTYPIVVGDGGIPNSSTTDPNLGNGGDTTFSGYVAKGGGAGSFQAIGRDGGSGGGGGFGASNFVGGNPVAGQGFAGGAGAVAAGGGGGGSSQKGGDAS